MSIKQKLLNDLKNIMSDEDSIEELVTNLREMADHLDGQKSNHDSLENDFIQNCLLHSTSDPDEPNLFVKTRAWYNDQLENYNVQHLEGMGHNSLVFGLAFAKDYGARFYFVEDMSPKPFAFDMNVEQLRQLKDVAEINYEEVSDPV